MNSVISVDTTELLTLAADLGNAAEVFGRGASTAVNRVADAARTETVFQISSQVNLEKPYVDGKVELATKATVQKPQAMLEISDEPVSLSRFGAQQQTKSNVWTAAKYAATFGSLAAPVHLPSGKTAQWIPRRGDSSRGIQQGQKAAGIRLRVSNGMSGKGNQLMNHLFLMPTLSGKTHAGKWGAFVHMRGSEKIKHLYGPSPYQVARGVWRDMEKELTNTLQSEVMTETTNEIDKALKTK